MRSRRLLRSSRLRASRDERGMVTAELAACLPVLMIVLAVALTAVAAVAKRTRLQDAAREAVRAAARGDDARARQLAEQVAPHSGISIGRTGADVIAVVTASIHPFGGWLPGMTISERAVAAVEPRGGSP